MAPFARRAVKASTPSCANRKLTAPSFIWRRNFCRTSASTSGSSSTTRICAVMRRVRPSFRSHYAAAQNRSAWSAALPLRPRLRQQLQPAHPRHIDIGEDQNERDCFRVSDALKRRRGRGREFHSEAPSTQLAAKLLTKQYFDIGLVIDDQN